MPTVTLRSAAPSIIAWAGAAAFVASVGWFLYCYAVLWGVAAPPGPRAGPIAINLALFSAFAVHHSLLARSGLKQRVRARIPAALERSLYTWISSVLFLLVCTLWQPVPGVLYRLDGLAALPGYLLQALGLALTLQSARAVDFLHLAGVRAVQQAAHGTVPPDAPLQTNGVYGVVRHPLYSAWILMVGGAPVMTATRASFAIISTAYIMLAVQWEERSLIDTFGPEYEQYRRRVKSKMIPKVY